MVIASSLYVISEMLTKGETCTCHPLPESGFWLLQLIKNTRNDTRRIWKLSHKKPFSFVLTSLHFWKVYPVVHFLSSWVDSVTRSLRKLFSITRNHACEFLALADFLNFDYTDFFLFLSSKYYLLLRNLINRE